LTSLVDQAIWTLRGDYDAGLPDREFWDRIAGDCGKPEPSKELLSALVALDASRKKADEARRAADAAS